MDRRLIVITGPTGVGKTDYSIELALKYGSPIISCDSRQIYKEMTIGTAVPSKEQLSKVKHYFIQTHSVSNLYTAGQYEIEALELISKLFSFGHDTLIMAGGSGFYIDAVCNGLDNIPSADESLRKELNERLSKEGVESLRMELKVFDPLAYSQIDIKNPQRVLRALEVCILSGRPFSSYKLAKGKKRDFTIEKICLTRPREELYSMINKRVLNMIDSGLVDEVRSLSEFRDLPALNTVGYKEVFEMLDGKISLDETVNKIQSSTRKYAKKQITWWRRDPEVKWLQLT